MGHHHRSKKRGRASDSSLVDTYFAPLDVERSDAKGQRKTRQLCRAVLEAVSLALGELGDERLLDASVLDVEPAPDAARLAIRIAAPVACLADVEDALASARPRLRALVAAEIQRKRAPEIVLVVVPEEAP